MPQTLIVKNLNYLSSAAEAALTALKLDQEKCLIFILYESTILNHHKKK